MKYFLKLNGKKIENGEKGLKEIVSDTNHLIDEME